MTHGIQITWRAGELLDATCPVCRDDQPKAAILDVPTLTPPQPTITLVACPSCSLTFFPRVTEPTSFEDAADAVAMTHFEAAVGLRGSIDCLARIDTSGVRRFLEVGCGTGFTLDYGRHVYGWEVLGVDVNATSRIARRELGVPIVHGLLGQTDQVQDRAWDLVFACEVIEHVTDPAAFLTAIRGALADDGIFLLRTPAAETLDPRRSPQEMLASLSPGYHTMLHTQASLDQTLRAAGFEHVQIVREADTLHAAASVLPFAWNPGGVLNPVEISEYLRERAAQLPRESASRLGLLQQLANDRVNAGDTDGAGEILEQLEETLVARYGFGLDAPAADVPTFAASRFCAALMSHALRLRLSGDLVAAEERFAATATVARAGIAALRDVNGFDPMLEVNLGIAENQGLALLCLRDPQAGAARTAALLAEAPDRGKLAVELAVALGAVGANRALATLEPEVRAELDLMPSNLLQTEGRWAIAMLALNHHGDHAEAARQFALAGQDAPTVERHWAARFHEGYALWHGGQRERATPLLREVVAAGQPAASYRERAESLLAYSG